MYKISIIVTCYNYGQYLNECLQSVYDQTYQDWECIIFNDGSIDNTEQIAQNWVLRDSRFKYFYKKENQGVSNARNLAILKATGDIILPLDADDKIDSSLLEQMFLVFKNDPDITLVNCRTQFFGTKRGELVLPEFNYQTLLIQNCFVCSCAFKKRDWIRIGGYDEQMKSFEDWEFWIRLLDENSRIHKINELLFFNRKHDKGSLSNKFKESPEFYFSLYDYIYTKNKFVYDQSFGNPIIAFQKNIELIDFNKKVKSNFLFKLYVWLKKIRNDFSSN